MSKIKENQNLPLNGAKAFINYKPAELRIHTQWLIVYYAFDPVLNKMVRHRVIVPVMKNKAERLRYAKTITNEINLKLASGWLPCYTNTSGVYKDYNACFDLFLKQIKTEVAKQTKRPDTLRSYTSNISMIKQYIELKKINAKLLLELDRSFFVNYLDYIFIERGNSATTHNNHLTFIIIFINYCIDRGWLVENFAATIKRKPKTKKIREVFTPQVKQKIKTLATQNPNYYALCMLTYYCFIRGTEATKLRVRDINLQNGYIALDGANTKNKKTQNVTIPAGYIPILVAHLRTANNNDYLFSANDFKTGDKQLTPKKISDVWRSFARAQKIPAMYQFYSFKDTGITDLLNAGVPAIKVRDQARHFDLKITENYTYRNTSCDAVVQNADFLF